MMKSTYELVRRTRGRGTDDLLIGYAGDDVVDGGAGDDTTINCTGRGWLHPRKSLFRRDGGMQFAINASAWRIAA